MPQVVDFKILVRKRVFEFYYFTKLKRFDRLSSNASTLCIRARCMNSWVLQTLACPSEPRIEASRTRWLAVGARGEIFLASGDNQKSAIWKYNRPQQVLSHFV